MEDMTEGVRKSLANVHGMMAGTAAQERAILKAATSRMEAVENEIRRLAPEVNTNSDAAMRQQDLTMELARLSKVAAQSKMVLGETS